MQGRLLEAVQGLGADAPAQVQPFLTAATKMVQRGMLSDDDITGAFRMLIPIAECIMGETDPNAALTAPVDPIPMDPALVALDAQFVEPFTPADEADEVYPGTLPEDATDQRRGPHYG